jgi:hypothetical protein
MKPFRITPDDFWDDTFADFKMARELSRLRAPERSEHAPRSKTRQTSDLIRDVLQQPENRVGSDSSHCVGRELNDQDGADDSIDHAKVNRSHQIDHAYWRRKIRCELPDRPASKTREIWMENSNFSTIGESEQAYKFPFPNKVLESMLQRTAELHTERYGEILRQDPTLPEKLTSLLRTEALAVFMDGVHDLGRLVDPMFLKPKHQY